jgi:predicted Rossmann fold nucleotide-binding protein DprA/Smf involved in DNA uptake
MKILASLGGDPLSVDKIAEDAQLDPSDVMAELTMLELDGRVIRGAGGYVLAP